MKRETKRARYQRLKNHPLNLAQQQETERLKYLQKRERSGHTKFIAELTPKSQRQTRKGWKIQEAKA